MHIDKMYWKYSREWHGRCRWFWPPTLQREKCCRNLNDWSSQTFDTCVEMCLK